MFITDFTTYSEIRATLGVDDEELPDTTLALEMYLSGLRVELKQIGAALPAEFVVIRDKDEAARTASEADVYDAVRLFAPYEVAVQLSTSLPLFAPKTITDGKAGVTRDASSPYKVAIEQCNAAYWRFRANLIDKYGVFKSASVAIVLRPFFSVVAPTTDPVTNT